MSGLEPQPDAARAADAALVDRVAKGDEQALALLYNRFAGLVFSLALRILGDEAAAEEIVQEVFLQVWNQAERYDAARSSVSTWLVLLARSRAIDRLRTRQVKARTLDSLAQENPPTYTSPDAPGSVLLDERRRRLRQELGELPAEQREVLELAFYRGLTQSEIAASTGVPLGTVKTRTLLAMKKLRFALQSEIRELL